MFFLDSADNLMAVDVTTSGNTVRLGVPHLLFHALAAQRQAGAFDVTGDGKKFLINSGNQKERQRTLDPGAELACGVEELSPTVSGSSA